jgi:tetratricopeptide (TPR) repeat protein
MPEWSTGYFYRGMCKDRVALKTHSLDLYNQLLDEARADLDKAIAIGPIDSRYFTGRAQIISHRQAVFENRTSEIEALNIGIDNLDAGARLGRYAGEDSEFYKPLFLSGVGRCQEAVDLAQKIIAANSTSKQLKIYEYGFMAIGYLCLEDYANAKQANEMPMQNFPDRDTQTLQARILVGLGDMDAAYSGIAGKKTWPSKT